MEDRIMENDDIIKPQKGSLNGYVDLHNHSTASDGSRTPSELVDMAAELGLSGMALTDHDTVNGCYELREAAKKYPNLKVISGCEFGVDHPGTKKNGNHRFRYHRFESLRCSIGKNKSSEN